MSKRSKPILCEFPRTAPVAITGHTQPLFLLSDACATLKVDPKATEGRLESDEIVDVDGVDYVTVSGFLALAFLSRCECWRLFRKWVTSEVLPKHLTQKLMFHFEFDGTENGGVEFAVRAQRLTLETESAVEPTPAKGTAST
jgi:hypothetical protein